MPQPHRAGDRPMHWDVAWKLSANFHSFPQVNNRDYDFSGNILIIAYARPALEVRRSELGWPHSPPFAQSPPLTPPLPSHPSSPVALISASSPVLCIFSSLARGIRSSPAHCAESSPAHCTDCSLSRLMLLCAPVDLQGAAAQQLAPLLHGPRVELSRYATEVWHYRGMELRCDHANPCMTVCNYRFTQRDPPPFCRCGTSSARTTSSRCSRR